ncbi:MAG: YtxH domain-containing protein [Muribaculaceae bacterium]
MKAVHVALAAFGGALVGATAALLLAPEKGSDARRHLKEFIKEKCPFVKDSDVDAVADRIEDMIESAEVAANQVVKK